MDSEKLLMLGGLAVGGWYLYENFFAIPADAQYLGQTNAAATLPDGSAIAAGQYAYYSPSLAKYYASSTAPTAAQLAAVKPATTTPVAGAAAGAVTPAATTTAPGSSTTTAAATLASIWQSIQAGVATDPNFTSAGGSVYQWQTYLNLAYPPAVGVDLSKVFPGIDPNQPITGAMFWGPMSSYLKSTFGLGIVGGSNSLYGLGDVSTDPTDPSAAALSPCSSITTSPGFVGPFNCDASGGAVNYTPATPQTNPYFSWTMGGGSAPTDYTGSIIAANPGANAANLAIAQALSNQPVPTTTNLTPWLLGGAALLGVMLVAGGSSPRRYGP